MLQNKVGELKRYNLSCHFNLLFVAVFMFVPLSAQTFSEYKNTQAESFQKYKDENDAKFNTYLKSEWEAYTAQIPDSLYEKPKPKELPHVPERSDKYPWGTTPIKVQGEGPKVIIELALPKESVTPKEISKDEKDITIDFYGTSLGFTLPHAIDKARFYPQTQEGISNFFDSIAQTEYLPLIKEIETTSKSMNLNDWGVYQLVLKLGKKLYANEEEAKLLSWFVFNKLGYAVKVGLSNQKVLLMHYAQKVIYATPNYIIDAKKYFVLSNYAKEETGNVFTYAQNYPESEKPLDLTLTSLPFLSENIKSKTLSFKQYEHEYFIPYEYNQNLIDFMASYPQADYETYFNAPIERRSFAGIATAMKKYIDNKKTSEAMNFVLNFVQNAFVYKTDSEQFGREKVMFAEETLYFDKSDCEDRAVLFSYLVKELFHVGVVGVKYKDHMATALYLPMQGDSVKAGSKKFIIADPTYINASIGESMPKYRSLKPERFIVVSN
ncbi:MAG: hypothetical protein NTZ60_02165 [Campylobacterales bacterium]|nr:hypothetical protein [Campylobacterales bacterium]